MNVADDFSASIELCQANVLHLGCIHAHNLFCTKEHSHEPRAFFLKLNSENTVTRSKPVRSDDVALIDRNILNVHHVSIFTDCLRFNLSLCADVV